MLSTTLSFSKSHAQLVISPVDFSELKWTLVVPTPVLGSAVKSAEQGYGLGVGVGWGVEASHPVVLMSISVSKARAARVLSTVSFLAFVACIIA